ncbi:TetR/AcrR family transcriptional regulator [Bordetella bronchiseptica]
MRHKTTKLDTRAAKAPRTKPAEVRLDELMSAAEKLFLAKGVEATTINEIVEQAQVAKGTFYHYFSSKNDMLEALGSRYTSQFLERLQDAVDACPTDDWQARLRTWIHVNVETYVQTYRTHDIVYTNHHHQDRSNQAKNAILDQLLEIIESGRSAGAWVTDQPRIVALLIYSGVHGATDDIIAVQPAECTAFAQAVAESCLRMLGITEVSNPKAIKSLGKSR